MLSCSLRDINVGDKRGLELYKVTQLGDFEQIYGFLLLMKPRSQESSEYFEVRW